MSPKFKCVQMHYMERKLNGTTSTSQTWNSCHVWPLRPSPIIFVGKSDRQRSSNRRRSPGFLDSPVECMQYHRAVAFAHKDCPYVVARNVVSTFELLASSAASESLHVSTVKHSGSPPHRRNLIDRLATVSIDYPFFSRS